MCGNQYCEIVGVLSANQALHGKQARDSFQSVIRTRISLRSELRHSGGFLTKNKKAWLFCFVLLDLLDWLCKCTNSLQC